MTEDNPKEPICPRKLRQLKRWSNAQALQDQLASKSTATNHCNKAATAPENQLLNATLLFHLERHSVMFYRDVQNIPRYGIVKQWVEDLASGWFQEWGQLRATKRDLSQLRIAVLHLTTVEKTVLFCQCLETYYQLFVDRQKPNSISLWFVTHANQLLEVFVYDSKLHEIFLGLVPYLHRCSVAYKGKEYAPKFYSCRLKHALHPDRVQNIGCSLINQGLLQPQQLDRVLLYINNINYQN